MNGFLQFSSHPGSRMSDLTERTFDSLFLRAD